MADLRRWLSVPPNLGGFRFGSRGPLPTPAERAASMTPEELEARARGLLPATVEAWREGDPGARALLRRLVGPNRPPETLERYPVLVRIRDAARRLLGSDMGRL